MAACGNHERARRSANLIDHWAIARFGDRLAGLTRCRQPSSLRTLDLSQRLLWCLAKRGTRFEVGDISDVPTVLFAVEYVDVIVRQLRSSNLSP